MMPNYSMTLAIVTSRYQQHHAKQVQHRTSKKGIRCESKQSTQYLNSSSQSQYPQVSNHPGCHQTHNKPDTTAPLAYSQNSRPIVSASNSQYPCSRLRLKQQSILQVSLRIYAQKFDSSLFFFKGRSCFNSMFCQLWLSLCSLSAMKSNLCDIANQQSKQQIDGDQKNIRCYNKMYMQQQARFQSPFYR